MKIKILLLFFTSLIYSQSGCIEYKISLNNREEAIDKLSKMKGSSDVLKLYENAKDITAFLYFDKTRSFYSLEKDMTIDNGRTQRNLTRIYAGKNDAVYFAKNDTVNLVNKDIIGTAFLVQRPLHKWYISNESKKIGQYLCYKAILKNKKGKQKTEAWFTPQIPFRYGAKEFNGLPGVVLEVSDRKLIYKAIKITLNPKEKVQVEVPPTDRKIISQKEYDELLKRHFPNLFNKKRE